MTPAPQRLATFTPGEKPRRTRLVSAGLVALAALAVPAPAGAAEVPSPASVLGFRPGDDFRLAPWDKVVEYFRKVDDASDRVQVRVLGETTEGRPYLAAVVSSAETLRDLDRYKAIQRGLHDPRGFAGKADRDRAVADGKPVVVIACSIHSTETASTLMATELLHGLASGDDPRTKEILEKTILVLVPSANPDGVEKVARWYERSKGTPWEGSGLPELYHHYAGHDTNRDWFMLNLKETRLLSRLLYTEWFPTLLYDVHQMGSRGARMFVPPFFDPINPNLDPRMNQGIFVIGSHMAADLAAEGKRGVLTHAMYDNWWNGGNRTTPQRHNIVAVLTEAASVKLASPIFLEKGELRSTTRGFADGKPAVNFVDPWPGGWWRLRDVVDYELITSRSLLTLAARYRDAFQANLASMAADAVAKGASSPPYAWVIPDDQRDPGAAAEMVRILRDTGIEVGRAVEPLTVGGATLPAGSYVLSAAQPYRAHLKDMMERQVYPNRLTANGRAEPPYDVAGWTLPLQMGVRVVEASTPVKAKTEPVDRVTRPKGAVVRDDDSEAAPLFYVIPNRSNGDFLLRNAVLDAGAEAGLITQSKNPKIPAGSILVAAGREARLAIDETLNDVSTRVLALTSVPAGQPYTRVPLSKKRVAVFQPWVPSMDEGWTRLVLETFKIPYTTVHNADVRSGGLRSRFDSLLIPSIEEKTLRDGYAADETEPDYVGGLGPEGLDALRAFVRDGGRLVCLDASCEYAIDGMNLPVKSVLKGLPTSDFYAPGSILRADVTPDPLTAGAPAELPVYFDHSLAFDVTPNAAAQVLARYAKGNPLESGWLLGPARIEGKAALVSVAVGQGSVVLFGFPPQHRGQTHGTFRLLFNALLN